jgi:predicted nucleotidyltransferase
MSVGLSNYSDELSQLCARYGVKRLELFGSGSRDDFDPKKSDFDLLVEFADPKPEGAFDRYFGLKEDLERLLRRPVDLVETQAIRNPYFRQAVRQDRILVYAA